MMVRVTLLLLPPSPSRPAEYYLASWVNWAFKYFPFWHVPFTCMELC